MKCDCVSQSTIVRNTFPEGSLPWKIIQLSFRTWAERGGRGRGETKNETESGKEPVCVGGGGVTLAHRLTGSLSLISSIFPSSFGFILLFVFLVFLHPSLLFSFYTPFPILFLSLLLSFQATSHPLSLSPFSLFTPFLPFSSHAVSLCLSLSLPFSFLCSPFPSRPLSFRVTFPLPSRFCVISLPLSFHSLGHATLPLFCVCL